MELLKAIKIDETEGIVDLSERGEVDRVKVLVSGDLVAESADRRFLLRINKIPSGYQSFVVMDGHAGGGEWDGNGFYVGRNGWGLDASVSIEYTISAAMLKQKRVGHGMATFGHGNNSILGYTCNGFCVSDKPITSISLATTGGLFTGTMQVYSF